MGTVATSAGRMSFMETGTGAPVVLLHANLHDRRDFDPVVPRLAQRHRVIALDWLAHGESDPVAEPDAMLFADVLAEVAAALDLPPAIVIGHSVGAYAAARLAVDHPARVAGLVLVSPGGFSPRTFASRLFCRVLGTPGIARRLMPRFVPYYMRPKTENDRLIAERVIARAQTDSGIRTFSSVWRSFTSDAYDLTSAASAIQAPTMIVCGASDPVIPPQVGTRASQAIKGSRLAVLDTGHTVFSSDPRGFLSAVEPFISSVEHPAPCTPP